MADFNSQISLDSDPNSIEEVREYEQIDILLSKSCNPEDLFRGIREEFYQDFELDMPNGVDKITEVQAYNLKRFEIKETITPGEKEYHVSYLVPASFASDFARNVVLRLQENGVGFGLSLNLLHKDK